MIKTITGWIGKSAIDANGKIDLSKWDNGHGLAVPGAFKPKGQRGEWDEIDWPPVKVKIIIEMVEGNRQ